MCDINWIRSYFNQPLKFNAYMNEIAKGVKVKQTRERSNYTNSLMKHL